MFEVICDVGAGTDIFTIPAAKITTNTVFALEINDEFLNIINTKAINKNLKNIKTLKVNDNHYDIYDDTIDFTLLVTGFHEIEDKKTLLAEIKRILRKTGKLIIIEFHDK